MYEPVLTTLPEGFVPYHQWPEYNLATNPFPSFNPQLINGNPRGMRWGLWPLTFEDYVSDTEPNMALSDPDKVARFRFVTWHRVLRTDRPKGWWQFLSKPARLEGFADLALGNDHTHGWDESARRYRKKWLAQYCDTTYSIEKVSFNDFANAYKKSPVAQVVRNYQIDSLERKVKTDTGNITLWVVRNIATKEIIAGMAVVDSPTYNGSYYMCGFYCDVDTDVPAMVGLMDHWYKTSKEKGLRFLHMGEFWMPGKPKNWKGFSTFKAKFGIHYLEYPPVLIRFVPGKLS